MTISGNHRLMRFLLTLLLAIFLGGCAADRQATPTTFPADFTLASDSFTEGGAIPQRYTCDGAGDSPQLAWAGPPDGTQSFALIVRDPDAPGGYFIHWVLYDVPADITALPSSPAGNVGLGQPGTNGAGRNSYTGPCPPLGTHHYYFTLYALDTDLAFDTTPSADDLTGAMEGHILGQAVLMGTYHR
jgi:Raf kinase inhibitor-like YbhB/YbcL family protein